MLNSVLDFSGKRNANAKTHAYTVVLCLLVSCQTSFKLIVLEHFQKTILKHFLYVTIIIAVFSVTSYMGLTISDSNCKFCFPGPPS